MLDLRPARLRAPLLALSLGFATAHAAGCTAPMPEAKANGSDVTTAQATPPVASKKTPPTELFEIDKVVDGDTIYIKRNGKVEKLRLLSVDTEERLAVTTGSATKPGTVFGEECALWAQSFFAALGKDGAPPKIGLEFPGGREQLDVYGRLLCDVILPDGTNYDLMIVEMGKSPYFTKYGRSENNHAAFVAAQKAARAAQRGIWDPKANEPKTPGVPSAKRPYEKLLPWWDERGDAVEGFRLARAADPSKVCDTDDAASLAAAAKSGIEVECFGEIRKVDEKDGGLVVHFRASDKDKAFVVFVPKEKAAAHKALDLPATTEEFHQNYVWFKAKVIADPKGYYKATSEDPAQWRVGAQVTAVPVAR